MLCRHASWKQGLGSPLADLLLEIWGPSLSYSMQASFMHLSQPMFLPAYSILVDACSGSKLYA